MPLSQRTGDVGAYPAFQRTVGGESIPEAEMILDSEPRSALRALREPHHLALPRYPARRACQLPRAQCL